MSETTIKAVTQNLCFGGVQSVYTHASQETRCVMRFGVFLPPQAASGRVPVLYWLSGLTCTEENFIVKAGGDLFAAGDQFGTRGGIHAIASGFENGLVAAGNENGRGPG